MPVRASLSTVSLDTPFIARQAIARISDPDQPAVQVTAPHAVLARESTAGGQAGGEPLVGRERESAPADGATA